jgi:hypothetical protein
MTIENNTKSPRVGIGISTPTSTLDVRGNATIKGDATDGGILTITRRYSTGAQTINFNNNHPSTNLDWTGARITSADAGNYNGYLDFAVSLGSNASETAGTAAVASVMRLTKDKRVGIGTTSPSKTLHVLTSDNEGIYLQGTGGGVWMDMQASGGQIHSVGAQVGGMGIYNRTASAYRFFITDGGNLGVGTTSPSYRLEVVTGGTLAQRLQSSNSTVGNPIIDIYDAGRAQETVISSTDGTTTGTYIASYSNHPLLFGTNAGSSPTAKVRIEADQVSSPISTMKIGPGGILWGGNNSGKEINSCQISAGYHLANSMNFVGMSTGTGSSDRRMDFWVEGGAFFRGTLTATGDIVAYGSTSDIRLKKNIILINGALDTLMKVNGYTFQWNEKAPEEKRDKTEYGVIAQEVEAAGLDLLIRDYIRPINGTGGDDTPPEVWKSVQYEKFVPILIEAIKELSTENHELKARLELIEAKIKD